MYPLWAVCVDFLLTSPSGSSVPQLCAVLKRVAGTGNSHVVRLLIAKIRALGFGILFCGAKRAAAKSVGGRTIHGLFSLSLDLEWQMKEGKTLWSMIRTANRIIVDAFSLSTSSFTDSTMCYTRYAARSAFLLVVLQCSSYVMHTNNPLLIWMFLTGHSFEAILLRLCPADSHFIHLPNRVRVGEESHEDHLILRQVVHQIPVYHYKTWRMTPCWLGVQML